MGRQSRLSDYSVKGWLNHLAALLSLSEISWLMASVWFGLVARAAAGTEDSRCTGSGIPQPIGALIDFLSDRYLAECWSATHVIIRHALGPSTCFWAHRPTTWLTPKGSAAFRLARRTQSQNTQIALFRRLGRWLNLASEVSTYRGRPELTRKQLGDGFLVGAVYGSALMVRFGGPAPERSTTTQRRLTLLPLAPYGAFSQEKTPGLWLRQLA